MGIRGLDTLRQEMVTLEREMMEGDLTPERARELRGELTRLREKLKESERELFGQNW